MKRCRSLALYALMFDVIAKTAGASRPPRCFARCWPSGFTLRVRLEPREGTIFEPMLGRTDGRLGAGLTTANCGAHDDAPPAASATGPCQALRFGAGPPLIGEGSDRLGYPAGEPSHRRHIWRHHREETWPHP